MAQGAPKGNCSDYCSALLLAQCFWARYSFTNNHFSKSLPLGLYPPRRSRGCTIATDRSLPTSASMDSCGRRTLRVFLFVLHVESHGVSCTFAESHGICAKPLEESLGRLNVWVICQYPFAPFRLWPLPVGFPLPFPLPPRDHPITTPG